ncbi:MAG: ABC transporter ATP-binding protein [Opitutaceae bacterium]|jgi:ABC-2 type transport system ATP-binding protein
MSTADQNLFLRIEGLHKTYKGASRPALAGVNLSISRGAFFGLLGPNGAGKTTLISILCGLLKADSGTIHVDGLSHTRASADVRRLIGLVPQEIALYPTLTARENLFFFGRMFGIPRRALPSLIDEWLEKLGLLSAADQRFSFFSGGMKRRCNLIAGVLHRPSLLILDEPTAGVDPQSRLLIYECLRDLNRSGTTILYTTHYLKEAEELCSSLSILDAGRIMSEGSPADLVASCVGARNLDDVFFHLTGHALRD